jgi:hypothetical protein
LVGKERKLVPVQVVKPCKIRPISWPGDSTEGCIDGTFAGHSAEMTRANQVRMFAGWLAQRPKLVDLCILPCFLYI